MSGGGGVTCPGEQGGGLTTSQPQVAGVASRPTSKDLLARLPANLRAANAFSSPVFQNNIVTLNRSFYWDAAYKGAYGGLRPDIAAGEPPVYWDLGVYGTYDPTVTARINAQNCLLTSLAGGYAASNRTGSPRFVTNYDNVYQATSRGSALGNFVSVTFTPTGLRGDYHVTVGSAAIDIGSLAGMGGPGLTTDLDGLPRPSGLLPDAGAYEFQVSPAAFAPETPVFPARFIYSAGKAPFAGRASSGFHSPVGGR
jgi:hypothetical protein